MVFSDLAILLGKIIRDVIRGRVLQNGALTASEEEPNREDCKMFSRGHLEVSEECVLERLR